MLTILMIDKRKTIELTRQARTDALTGLINRREIGTGNYIRDSVS